MTRVTAPMSKLCRSLSTTAAAPKPSNSILTTSKTAAPLSRKYAELLKERGMDSHDSHPRHLTTTTKPRPYPPTRNLRLMQTFTTTSRASVRDDVPTIDFAYLPTASFPLSSASGPDLRVPLLPDNFLASHATPETLDAPLAQPEVVIVAAHPEQVAPSVLTEVEGMGIDGVELRFAHHENAGVERQEGESGHGMLGDIWKGLVDDVFGGGEKTRKPA